MDLYNPSSLPLIFTSNYNCGPIFVIKYERLYTGIRFLDWVIQGVSNRLDGPTQIPHINLLWSSTQ